MNRIFSPYRETKHTTKFVAMGAILALAIFASTFSAKASLLPSYAEQKAFAQTSNQSDPLFVTDFADDTVKVVNTTSHTGTVFIPRNDEEGNYRLKGPAGVIAVGNTLYVINQNVATGKNGEIIKFDKSTGAFAGYLVKNNDKDAPWAPRGAVLSPDGESLYVASFEGKNSTESGNIENLDMTPGSILKYSISTGALQGRFAPPENLLGQFNDEFHPRGLVFHDGKLYISVMDDQFVDRVAGHVIRFDPSTSTFDSSFVISDVNLHRPEGLVFAPDGKLWVTSFRATTSDVDRLIAFDVSNNVTKADEIALYSANEPRVFAQAILFGPGGSLFVPMSNTGELRSYNVSTHAQTIITPAGAPLKGPQYLSFGKTNPSTLDYNTQ